MPDVLKYTTPWRDYFYCLKQLLNLLGNKALSSIQHTDALPCSQSVHKKLVEISFRIEERIL